MNSGNIYNGMTTCRPSSVRDLATTSEIKLTSLNELKYIYKFFFIGPLKSEIRNADKDLPDYAASHPSHRRENAKFLYICRTLSHYPKPLVILNDICAIRWVHSAGGCPH
jgi:hypothetical protein